MNIPLLIKETLRGKTISRILFNDMVRIRCTGVRGSVLDLGGTQHASYARYISKDIVRTPADIQSAPPVDFNKPLPYADGQFDNAFFFNALYIAEAPVKVLAELRRVVRSGGHIYISSPYIANEMPEPHDFYRFTKEGLLRVLREAGLEVVSIDRMGERFSSAVYLLHPFFLHGVVRLFVHSVALLLDACIPRSVCMSHPTPLGYFIVARTQDDRLAP